MARRLSQGTKYNEAYFRSLGGPGPTAVGLFVVLLIVVGTYLAFTKSLPFTGEGYKLNATFQNAANIATRSPVRIAGVNVGEVTEVERVGNNSRVSFTVTDEGRPIHSDAFVKIRPRIFLEGNFFLDLSPGSPSAAELPDGGTIPISRTSTAVQLDELLTALQAPDRRNLVELLEG
ncbi:MAG: MlaD family protein, partial [Solirubrobacterales bacterium]